MVKEMKKTVTTLILAMILVILSAVAISAAEATYDGVITVGTETTMAGNEVVVDISLKNNPGILAMTLKLTYNEELATLVSIERGDCLSAQTFTPPKELKNGINLPWDAEYIEEEDISDGVMLKLHFKVSDKATSKDTIELGVSYDIGAIIDNDFNTLKPEIVNGKIKIIDYIPGDLNRDGIVNTTDVAYLRRYIAGGYGVTILEAAADVNGDGLINTTDAVWIRRFIAGGYGVTLKPGNICSHIEVTVPAVAPGCTTAGKTEYVY